MKESFCERFLFSTESNYSCTYFLLVYRLENLLANIEKYSLASDRGTVNLFCNL